MDERKKNNHNKGITLIALIVTIIIMLILLGVTTDIVIDKDFFNSSKNAVEKANSQRLNKEKQEENITENWDTLPGNIIKGDTNIKID